MARNSYDVACASDFVGSAIVGASVDRGHGRPQQVAFGGVPEDDPQVPATASAGQDGTVARVCHVSMSSSVRLILLLARPKTHRIATMLLPQFQLDVAPQSRSVALSHVATWPTARCRSRYQMISVHET